MFSTQAKVYGEKNHNVVLVFAGWEIKKWHLFLLGHLLASYNFKAFIFTWDKDILTNDTTITLSRFEEVKKTALLNVSNLSKKEQKNIAIFGLGQASVLGLMVANNIQSVSKIILNLVGADLSEIIWHNNLLYSDVKEKLIKNHLTLPKLKKIWGPLSPINNLEKLHVKEILIYLATKDEVIPFKEQEAFLNELQKKDCKIEAIVNTRHNHALSEIVNLLRFSVYINFLKRPVTAKRPKRQK
jgi:esterase/lipase